MELKDLYDIDDETMYNLSMEILPAETKIKLEEMFTHQFGLELIENLFEECVKNSMLPKEISDNVIRGLRWKYIQLIPNKEE